MATPNKWEISDDSPDNIHYGKISEKKAGLVVLCRFQQGDYLPCLCFNVSSCSFYKPFIEEIKKKEKKKTRAMLQSSAHLTITYRLDQQTIVNARSARKLLCSGRWEGTECAGFTCQVRKRDEAWLRVTVKAVLISKANQTCFYGSFKMCIYYTHIHNWN